MSDEETAETKAGSSEMVRKLSSTLSASSQNKKADVMKYCNLKFALTTRKTRKLDRFRITRYRGSGLLKGRFPEYELWFEFNRKRYFILAAKREKGHLSSVHSIYLDRDLLNDPIAYVKSNFKGTEFSVNLGSKNRETEYLAVVKYGANVFGFKGPRSITVAVPEVDEKNERHQFIAEPDTPSLVSLVREELLEKIIMLVTKDPEWDAEIQSHKLDFKGRVNVPSVKNFQLVCKGLLGKFGNDGENVKLQFGKFGVDNFILDFGYPFCPLQAFGVALTALENKLACE